MKLVLIVFATVGFLPNLYDTQAAEPPPSVPREFRGVWIATVSNIDWPSRPGLPAERQKSELIAMLDKAVELNLNAIIFQVRPAADALYPSKLEPWSPYLSGQMGKPPEPYYDPLEFAVEEAHRRGLQLHVWFNPYRVRLDGARGKASADHSSRTRKDIVRKYGNYLWFDPGEPEAVEHFINVLNDVVKRYDIDGVHIDDYFYPYQVKDDAGKIVPFPDDASYKRAVRKGERLERDDWRRQNVNHLIERMYEEVKRAKPWVQVGISPFGIWRPENPPGIVGLDQYSTLYADARLWLQQGWLDYMTPQLYWQVDSKGQSYPKLLAWWAEQNTQHRHLWPGNFTSKVRRSPSTPETREAWSAEELIRQIEATRAQPGASGNIHFSMKALMHNYDGIADKLKAGVYAEPALVPESPWLGREAPARPEVAASRSDEGVIVDMELPRNKSAWQWLVRVQTNNGWKTVIVPGQETSHVVALEAGDEAKAVTVAAVSRLGREGRPARAEIESRD
ncbi:MAG: family 10 glycosylhydrolase [Planctomycetes bacterium]|nr:family 10 glycosylhydrolase [Planctomycetota bacterium]